VRFALAYCLIVFVCSLPVHAQESAAGLDDLQIAPTRKSGTAIELPGLEEPEEEVAENPDRDDVSYLPGRWAGFWVSTSNHGMTRSLFKASGDELLLDDSSEKVLGLGLLLDVALSPSHDASFRLKGGYGRSTLKPGKTALAASSPGQLETSLNLFHLSLLTRRHFPNEMGYGLWYGGGVSIQYAYSTSTGSSTELAASKLQGSAAIAPVLAAGVEIPFPGFEEFFLEGDWIVFKGYALYLGLRTSL
jgi:hypothetical protein